MLNVFEFPGFSFVLYCSRDKSKEIFSSKEKTVASYGLNHGDMIYLWPLGNSVDQSEPSGNASTSIKNGGSTSFSSSVSTSSSILGSKIPTRSNVEEDQVDVLLQKMDGKVKRKRDPKRQVIHDCSIQLDTKISNTCYSYILTLSIIWSSKLDK